jgi:hypothetical protein
MKGTLPKVIERCPAAGVRYCFGIRLCLKRDLAICDLTVRNKNEA